MRYESRPRYHRWIGIAYVLYASNAEPATPNTPTTISPDVERECTQWRPGIACVRGLRHMRIGERGTARDDFNECARAGDQFGRYGMALLMHDRGDETRYRRAAESLLADPGFGECRPCAALAQRDLALSYFFVAPHDQVLATRMAAAGCQLTLTTPSLLTQIGPCQLSTSWRWTTPLTNEMCRTVLGSGSLTRGEWDYSAWW